METLAHQQTAEVVKLNALDSATSLDLDSAIAAATESLQLDQKQDGHWIYELEADCTIPAEFIMMMHFMDELDGALEQKLATYLRNQQAEHDGWPLYYGGDFNLSCSVKAYYALKLAGDDPAAAHMVRARNAILAHGGAAHSNVFTRIALALFEQVPWRAVPFIPAEVILLPRWFPFHISKVSYWSRTVMVPLFILCTLKPSAANPRGIDIRELFVIPADEEQHYFRHPSTLSRMFLALDRFGRWLEKLVPGKVRQYAIKRCEDWFIERLNGTEGLGGIFPAMVNAYECLALLGYPPDHPYRVQAREALEKLLVVDKDSAYCQPCMSPVWDTCLATQALHEGLSLTRSETSVAALDWLRDRQLDKESGDWQDNHSNLAGGGWPFQYANSHYPDLDDTSVVAWAMYRVDKERYRDSIERAADWVFGMQSTNGGWGSFDSDNTHHYLNAIPFADHGALLDPPTSDLTARCLAILSLTDKPEYRASVQAGIEYLKSEQEDDGSWFGRWGTNYIYGTWSALAALEVAGEEPNQEYIRNAIKWLYSAQNDDGGWGESNDSYYPPKHPRPHPSTSFQTAWAVLGLMAVDGVHSIAVKRGIDFLLSRQQADGLWLDANFTAPGFPRVFYLKYHGYCKYFPLWAIGQYRNRLRGLELN